MKHIVCIAAAAFAAIASAIEIPIYSHKKSDKQLHVQAESKGGEIYGVWHFPSSYTGKRSVVDIPVSDTNANFIAWVGDATFKPGEPFGVSNRRDYNAIDLTETSPIFGRINLLTGENDREAVYGKNTESVRKVPGDFNALSINGSQNIIDRIEGMKRVRVRVDRFAVNDLILGKMIYEINVPNRVLIDKVLDLDQKPFLHEGDVLDDEALDIDWLHAKSEIITSRVIDQKFGGRVSSISYRIVIGDEDFIHPTAATNKMFSTVFVRKFSETHTSPKELSASALNNKPSFSWSMGGDESFVAFKVIVMQGGITVRESEILRAPPRDSSGYYQWNSPWTLAVGNYIWKVSMYNAKFPDNEEKIESIEVGSGWSDAAGLTID